MADPIEEICTELNALDLPQVHADQSPQGSLLPYVVVSRLNPQLDRYFGGAIQDIDFQVKQYYNKYSDEQSTSAKADHTTIYNALELQQLGDVPDKCRLMHRLAPYRLNIDDDNNFSIVQAWNLYYEE